MDTSRPKVIRSTSARTFRACPRLYRYQFVDGYRPTQTPEALTFGLFWHELLEQYQNPDRQLSPKPPPDEHMVAKAMAMLAGYKVRWERDNLTVLAAEVPYTVPLVNPETGRQSQIWQHQGRIDAIARDSAGKLCVVEYKTTSEDIGAGAPYWAKLRLDQQVSNYFVGARALGYAVEHCLYDVARKPALRPYEATPTGNRRYTKAGVLDARQHEHDESPDDFFNRCVIEIAENPDRYYARGEVVRLEGETEDAAFDLWQTAKMIRESERCGRWPRNPEACNHWGRECSFFGVCTGEASLEDPMLFTEESNQ